MQIEDYSLIDSPFSDHFVIPFPFPQSHRNELVERIRDIPDSVIKRQIENSREDILEREIANRLEPIGYYYSKDQPEECQLWRPDYKYEADFYNPRLKISIEVEKTEKKRIVHDVLKLINGSMTFLPKVRYGVLVFPDRYVRKSGLHDAFFSTVKREMPFYFQKMIPEKCNLHDVLLIVYKVPHS